jgi:two-component system cell cycle response regulator
VKILIADDQPLDRAVLKMTLEKWGYEVIEAEDGAEAMKILNSEDSPGLAILDWMMPGLSGPEICLELRYQERTRYVYVLLLSAKDNVEDLVQGMAAGADDYISKPVDMHELQVRLRAGRRILELQEELIATREELRTQATRDFLTGISNRGSIMEQLTGEVHRSVRQGTSLAVLMCDVDFFKRINDTHGHPAGDAVLKEVANRMHSAIRPYDAVGRFGGEEFLVLCPGTDAAGGAALARRLRETIASTPIVTDRGPIDVTVSIGLSARVFENVAELDQIISEADAALYAAKHNGRNRVEVAAAAAPTV